MGRHLGIVSLFLKDQYNRTQCDVLTSMIKWDKIYLILTTLGETQTTKDILSRPWTNCLGV